MEISYFNGWLFRKIISNTEVIKYPLHGNFHIMITMAPPSWRLIGIIHRNRKGTKTYKIFFKNMHRSQVAAHSAVSDTEDLYQIVKKVPAVRQWLIANAKPI